MTRAIRETGSRSRGALGFLPLQKPSTPPVKEAARVQNPVDAFVLARLEERGWTFTAPASRTEWIRRVTFDLTGLPPTPEEIESYEEDTAVMPMRGWSIGS